MREHVQLPWASGGPSDFHNQWDINDACCWYLTAVQAVLDYFELMQMADFELNKWFVKSVTCRFHLFWRTYSGRRRRCKGRSTIITSAWGFSLFMHHCLRRSVGSCVLYRVAFRRPQTNFLFLELYLSTGYSRGICWYRSSLFLLKFERKFHLFYFLVLATCQAFGA